MVTSSCLSSSQPNRALSEPSVSLASWPPAPQKRAMVGFAEALIAPPVFSPQSRSPEAIVLEIPL